MRDEACGTGRLSQLLGDEGWMERAHMMDYFIGTNQKIPGRPIKITFLEQAKTAVM